MNRDAGNNRRAIFADFFKQDVRKSLSEKGSGLVY